MEKQLPKNWVETELGNYAMLKNGYAFKSNDFQTEGLPVVKISNIKDFKIEIENSICVDESKLKPDFIIAKGDILIAMSGATTGKYGVFEQDVIALQNQRVGNLKPIVESLSNRRFLLYLLGSLKEEIEEKAYGAAQPNISPKLIESINIFLPPLTEQNRIVDKLDRLFAQLETIKTSMANIPLLLKDFRQQVLTQAVTGKLTEEWRKGTKLGAVKLITKIHPIEYSILDFSKVPSNWTITALGNFAICSRGKFTPRPRNDPKYFDGIYPFMQIGDLPREGGLTSSYSKTLNELGKKVSKSFEKDTVVIAIVGATIGNTGILNEKMYFPDSLIGIDSSNEKSNIYIEYFLRVCKYSLREISYSSGGQPNINTQVIKNLGIAIAPFEEQQEIVSRVESLFAKADAIEQQYKTLKACIDNVPQAILHKAFKGELTEQLDSDGDAKELLEEIKALKYATGKVIKSKTQISKAKKVKNYPEEDGVLDMVAEHQ